MNPCEEERTSGVFRDGGAVVGALEMRAVVVDVFDEDAHVQSIGGVVGVAAKGGGVRRWWKRMVVGREGFVRR